MYDCKIVFDNNYNHFNEIQNRSIRAGKGVYEDPNPNNGTNKDELVSEDEDSKDDHESKSKDETCINNKESTKGLTAMTETKRIRGEYY